MNPHLLASPGASRPEWPESETKKSSGKAKSWIPLTWFSKVPRDSHHWLLLLLGDHPVEEKLPQMAQETSFSPKTSSKSLSPSPSPELTIVTGKG